MLSSMMSRRLLLVTLALGSGWAAPAAESDADRHFLYVATPGIRNYLEFGGAGLLVFDIDRDHRFVRRIDTPAASAAKPENIKGICASARTGMLYFTTLTTLYCVDLVTDKTLWERRLPGGCDRPSIRPDGAFLYVPSLEGPYWNVVAGDTGEVVKQVETKSGSHNTVRSLDGKRMFLAGLRSPSLTVCDTSSHEIVGTVGPFSHSIRPFTVNGKGTTCFVNVNDLLGFEVGNITTGNKVCRVEVSGFEKGTVKRHGCPSHGIGLTPNEEELWLCDGANNRLHIFDATQVPPRQIQSIGLREQPGWITFSLDGKFAYPSTGEVINTATKQIVYLLTDEEGRQVHSEKMIEVVMRNKKPVTTGDQFGVGRNSE